MRTDMIKAQIAGEAFAIGEQKMQVYVDALNNNAPHIATEEKIANNSVEYQTVGSLAIISIDGAMWKKPINGACGASVASYSTIDKYIDQAEQDTNINTTLFVVDTPGGSVAGVDTTENRIYTSKNKTATFTIP